MRPPTFQEHIEINDELFLTLLMIIRMSNQLLRGIKDLFRLKCTMSLL